MLAAYNAGYNRVKRARSLAEEMSLDKNRWFDNVETAMLALSKPYFKDGKLKRYCRCGHLSSNPNSALNRRVDVLVEPTKIKQEVIVEEAKKIKTTP